MDLEKSIVHHMRYCRHYKPGQLLHSECRAGENVQSKRALARQQCDNEGVVALGAPCVNGHLLKDLRSVCARHERVAREEAEKAAAEDKAAVDRLIAVLPLISEWRRRKPIGKQEVVECPLCKGKLHLGQASNGHVHGACETQGCVKWME